MCSSKENIYLRTALNFCIEHGNDNDNDDAIYIQSLLIGNDIE